MLLAQDHLTKDVIWQLYTYTERKMNKLKGSVIFSRLTAEDIAHDAIAKTLSNERPWNSEKCPDLFVHLAGSAKSIISNQRNLKEVKSLETKDDLDCLYKKVGNSQTIVETDSMLAHRANRNAFSTPEEIQSADSSLNFLLKNIKKHRPDLIPIAEAMLVHEVSKPQDLAPYLGISVSEVNTQKLALKRIIYKIQEEE